MLVERMKWLYLQWVNKKLSNLFTQLKNVKYSSFKIFYFHFIHKLLNKYLAVSSEPVWWDKISKINSEYQKYTIYYS